METPKFKTGDKVVIKPYFLHEDHVKENYCKVLEIENVIEADETLYKIKGIRNYAKESDLFLCKPYFTQKFYEKYSLILDILNKLNSSKFVKELDMYDSGEFLIFEVLRNEFTQNIVSEIISDLDTYSEQNKQAYTYSGNELDFSLLMDEYKSVFDSEYEIKWNFENREFCFADSLWED